MRRFFVVGISDGETVTARCGAAGSCAPVNVRLCGKDTPEQRKPFGERAKQARSDLAYISAATVEVQAAELPRRSIAP